MTVAIHSAETLRGRPGLALWVCAALLVGLHFLLPITAVMLSQAEPSFADEAFPWLSKVNKDSPDLFRAAAAHLGTGQWRMWVRAAGRETL